MEAKVWKTQKGLLIGAAGAFAAGVISTWVLMGAESGSKADWVAAAGTWVIGYGAWKYAREAHRLREQEIERETARDRYMHAGRVQAMKEWAKLLQKPHTVISGLLEREGEKLSAGYANGTARGLQEILRMIPLDDEAWRYLAKDDVGLKMRINTYIVLLLGESEKLIERSADADEETLISEVKHSRWPEICETVKTLSKLGGKLDLAADAIPEI